MFLFSGTYQDVATLGEFIVLLRLLAICMFITYILAISVSAALHVWADVFLSGIQRQQTGGCYKVCARIWRSYSNAYHGGGRHACSRYKRCGRS